MSNRPTQTVRSLRTRQDPSHEPIAPIGTARPSLLSRVGKYALIVGAFCAAVGAIEGALAGSLLAPSQERGTYIMVIAFDRCMLIGLAGTVVGAAIGAFDWFFGSRKQKARQ
jgi:hypothetical protein